MSSAPRFSFGVPALCLAALFLAPACAEPDATPAAPDADSTAMRDSTASAGLLQTLRRQQRFSLFTTMLDSAGFGPLFRNGEPYTVFAATNSGLDQLPDGVIEELLLPQNRDRLTSVLGYHVHPGKLSPKDVREADSVSTLTRRWLPVTLEGGRVMIGEAAMSESTFTARNGRLYAINALVLPPVGSGVPALPEAPPAADTLGTDTLGTDSGISSDGPGSSDARSNGDGTSGNGGDGNSGSGNSGSGNSGSGNER